MLKNILISTIGLAAGIILGYFIISYFPNQNQILNPTLSQVALEPKANKEVLSFLPYWFLNSAQSDYSGFITTLDYFSLTPDSDGTILKYTAPGQSEPGYYALTSGKADSHLDAAKQNNIKLSLTIFDGDQNRINELISDPVNHADNLIKDLVPFISKFGFSELNMDIESIEVASPSAQLNYQSFIHEIHNQISSRNLNVTLSMDIIPVDFIRNDHLAVPANLAKDLDKIILMAYDFHSPSSFVTGPVAPLHGAGTVAEFDTEVAIKEALKNYDSSKILLGIPTYGYSWETIDNFERAAIIPTTAQIKSNKDVEEFLSNCNSCSTDFDQTAEESYVIYKNTNTNTFQQIFYPDARSITSKINFVKGNNLGGLAIWALGYEGSSILNPVKSYLGH
jgi:spore germination protein YaaH